MAHVLKENSAIPLYRQLKEKLRTDYIDSSSGFDVSSAIPSEQELMQMYGVSRITVRNAVKELVNEGFLKKVQGKGTFVTQLKNYPLNSGGGFSVTCSLMHLTPSHRVIEMKEVPACEEDRLLFSLQKEDPVFYVQRLRLGDGLPFILEHIYLPPKFRYLTKQDLESSLYKALEKECGPVTNPGPSWMELHQVYGRSAELLGLEESSPVIKIQEYGYDRQQTHLHRTRLLLRPDFRYYLR